MPLDTLHIRRANKNDVASLSRLTNVARTGMHLFYTPYFLDENLPPDTEEDFLNLIPRRDIYVADHRGRVVGTAALNGISVGMVYVDPEFQGKGVGGKLIKHLISMAQERKIPLLTVHASLNSVQFYRSYNFVDIRTEISHADFPARFMERKISTQGFSLLYFSDRRHASVSHNDKFRKEMFEVGRGKTHEVFVLEDAEDNIVATILGSYMYDVWSGLRGFCVNDISRHIDSNESACINVAIMQLAMLMYFSNYRLIQIKEDSCKSFIFDHISRSVRGNIQDDVFVMHENTLENFTA